MSVEVTPEILKSRYKILKHMADDLEAKLAVADERLDTAYGLVRGCAEVVTAAEQRADGLEVVLRRLIEDHDEYVVDDFEILKEHRPTPESPNLG